MRTLLIGLACCLMLGCATTYVRECVPNNSTDNSTYNPDGNQTCRSVEKYDLARNVQDFAEGAIYGAAGASWGGTIKK